MCTGARGRRRRWPSTPAFGVNGQPVGTATIRNVDEGTAVAQRGLGVVVEDVDAVGRRVVVVGAGTIRAPPQSVGDGDVGEDGAYRKVRSELVHGPRARPLVVGHRAAVEPAVGVTATFVHPHRAAGPELG